MHPGQKLLIMLPNIPEFVVAYFGILKTGGVVVPINVLYKAREIEFLLSDSEAVGLVACTEFLAEALEAYRNVETCKHLILVDFPGEPPAISDSGVHRMSELVRKGSSDFEVVATCPEDTAVIGYTSGTTGKPKGAELSHFNLFYQCRVLPELVDEPLNDDEVRMAVLPLFHSFGQSCIMNTVLAMGSTMTLMRAIRSRQGDGDRPARQGDALCRRAHDVGHDAQSSRSGEVRPQVAADVRQRRRADAGRDAWRPGSGCTTRRSAKVTA